MCALWKYLDFGPTSLLSCCFWELTLPLDTMIRPKNKVQFSRREKRLEGKEV